MKSPLVPSDLFALANPGDPQLAPDGSVYFVCTRADRETDANVSSIWHVAAGRSANPFTSGRNDRLPRVAPDGATLAFVGDRDDATRIQLIATTGGEARVLGDAYPKITALRWSPDGTRLAFVAPAPHDPRTARMFLDAPSGARHIRALPFKSDLDGLLDGTRRHLWLIDLASATTQALTSGDFDVSAPAWSPDGKALAFRASIGAPECALTADIHVVDLATGARRALTHGEGPMDTPAWSNDGRSVAFTGHLHGDDVGGRYNTELLVIDVSGGPIVSLSAPLDRTVGDAIIGDLRSGHGAAAPAWSDDDGEIVAQVSAEGACGLRAFARTGSGVRDIASGDREIFDFTYRRGAIAFAFSTPQVPGDLALLDAGGRETRLTAFNAAFLAEKLVVVPQRFRPVCADGTVLDGWLLAPPSSAPGPAPLILEVHGGPHSAYGHSFFFEFQILAGTGCAVAYGNPRGGQSYGHAYADAITGDWGGVDAADVQTILDGALAAGTFDASRIGLAGGSYGGFMTTWLLGNTNRFAAGVSMRAVNDFVSEVGASDIGWFLETEVQAPPILADGGRCLFEASPLRAAPQIDAPLLIEHSERDYRCPIDQAEQLFTLLRRLGKQVEFVRFTGDGHELSRGGKPRNRVLRLRAIAHWFLRHLQPAGSAPSVDEAGALFRPLPNESEL